MVLADKLTKVRRMGGGREEREKEGEGERESVGEGGRREGEAGGGRNRERERERSKGKDTPILIILLILMGRLPGISARTKKRRYLNISVDMLHSTDPDVPAIPSKAKRKGQK